MNIFRQILGKKAENSTSTANDPQNSANASKKREFVIIGMGRFGTTVAETLVYYNHDVLAIDANPERVQHVSKTLPHVVQLDATNADSLEQIGITEFGTGLVCISSNFEDNLLATVLLRRFGVPRIITKAATHLQKTILEEVGANLVILPEHEAGLHLGRRLASRHTIDNYMEIRDGLSVVEVSLPPKLVGLTLAQSNLRQKLGLNVIAIDRGSSLLVNPSADFIMRAGDMLLVLGQIEKIEQMQS